MDLPHRDDASFRDPSGHVYHLADRVLRSVSPAGAENYEFIRTTGLLHDLAATGQVLETQEVPISLLGDRLTDERYLLEHPRIAFISYPYEWCFAALKSAALLQIDLLLEALKRDATMSDASAYNVQFIGPQPIFIDVLSFRPYQDGDYWLAHQQFCNQFLNPLLLTALRGIHFNAWFRGSPEGINAEELVKLLPWSQKLRLNVLTHVTLPARFQARAEKDYISQTKKIGKRRLPRRSFVNMLVQLHHWIERLKPLNSDSGTWVNYADTNVYEADDQELKKNFVRRFAGSVKPRMLWDFGCNTGVYSETALEAGAQEIIGFDSDSDALDIAFETATKKNLKLLPLFLDGADPSPGQGWRGREHKSLDARAPADALLALAFIHHLVIRRNIPLTEAISWLIGMAPEGVIEFVEKEDPTIKRMLALRSDVFKDYHRDAFLSAVRAHADIVEQVEIIENRRLLIWYRRRS
jgi:ribosomal protein L11 methylase PrmA